MRLLRDPPPRAAAVRPTAHAPAQRHPVARPHPEQLQPTIPDPRARAHAHAPAPALPRLMSLTGWATPPPLPLSPRTYIPHPAATAPADAAPLLARVFAPVAHPVALAIETTETVCAHGSPGGFALGAGRGSLQAIVAARHHAWCACTTPSPHCVCIPSRSRTPPSCPAATTPVDAGPLLSRPRPSPASRTSPRAPRASRVLSTNVGADRAALAIEATGTRGASTVDPAATGAVLQALKKVCVHGSLGPFVLEAGADVGAVDPAATGAALQAFFRRARGGATPGMNDALLTFTRFGVFGCSSINIAILSRHPSLRCRVSQISSHSDIPHLRAPLCHLALSGCLVWNTRMLWPSSLSSITRLDVPPPDVAPSGYPSSRISC
ncbi:hypothetical protein B0H14DRAFT_3462857 [Mycena olivaceomarginata]|nr:hypothetical protein B0H14DRAFT_3462857 [Mycena olivaceomarginata]